MCGRYAFTSPVEAVAGFFDANASEMAEAPPNTNVCPTQEIVTVVPFDGQLFLSKMRWGFLPHWYKSINDGPLLINARLETISDKPAYKSAYMSRRCIIPVNWYYEWSRKNPNDTKKKYKIGRSGDEILACAGIWQAWRDPSGKRLVSCAMITKEANEMISQVHHRMPLTLTKQQLGHWLYGLNNESLLEGDQIGGEILEISQVG